MVATKNESPDKIQKSNLKILKAHINGIRSKIKPNLNHGTIYAGKFVRFGLLSETEKILPKGDRNHLMNEMKDVWKILKSINKRSIAAKGTLLYDTLEEVLTDIKAPVLTCPDTGKKEKFGNFYECAKIATNPKTSKVILNTMIPAAETNNIWKQLSGIYVGNAKGDLKIIEGVDENLNALGDEKIMISTELERALKNPDFSEDTKKKLRRLFDKYKSQLPDSKHAVGAELKSVKKRLKKDAKILTKAPK